MRSHSEYIPLTQDQIALAQHTDIVEFLINSKRTL